MGAARPGASRAAKLSARAGATPVFRGRWLTELRVASQDGDRERLVLLADLRFCDPFWRIWTVPAGTTTDGASYPRALPGALHVALPSSIRSLRAGVLHDFLYQQAGRELPVQVCDGAELRLLVSRGLADQLIRWGLEADGVPAWRAWLVRGGLCLGGWYRWGRYLAQNAAALGLALMALAGCATTTIVPREGPARAVRVESFLRRVVVDCDARHCCVEHRGLGGNLAVPLVVAGGAFAGPAGAAGGAVMGGAVEAITHDEPSACEGE